MTKIMKGGIAYNSTANMVALTQAEYDALTTAQKNNGNFYFITDADPSYFSAENIDYDNTTSGLTATNVQSAVDELASEKADQSTTYTKTEVNTLLNSKIGSDYFTISTVSVSNLSASANTDYYQSIDATKSGYTPIGTLGYNMSGSYNTRFHVSGIGISNNNAYINFRANGESFSTSNLYIGINVLYRKN